MHRLIVTAAALLLSFPACAVTYVVTSTDDSGVGTLRQALEDANDHIGADTITFDIAGPGVHTIAPTSVLPPIADALSIDGYTQPGSQPNTNLPAQGGLNGVLRIELSGANLPFNSNGLFLQNVHNADTTIRGLVINGFSSAINLGESADGGMDFNVTIEGCYLGTDAAGAMAVGSNQNAGISGTSQVQNHLVIGGEDAAARNLIAGFNEPVGSSYGIVVQAKLGGPIIRGNLIGTDASGTVAIANGRGVGISQTGFDSVPPGALVKDNLISGNMQGALLVTCDTPCIEGLAISGNVIGARRDGNAPLPNGGYGIRFNTGNASDTHILIGGDTDESQNVIAWNTGYGITMANNTEGTIEIARNRIFNNSALDIDLPNPEHGRNSNDSHDADSLYVNRGQNFPVIVSASRAGNQLTVRYKVPTGTAYATYPLTVRFYRGATSGGDRWLADDTYDAVDAEMEKQVVLNLPSGLALPSLIATAADAAGNTSEFSDPYALPIIDLIFADGFEQP